MALINIPDEVWQQIKAAAEASAEQAARQRVEEYATEFVDVTSMDDGSNKRLMHVATGRILKITAEWE